MQSIRWPAWLVRWFARDPSPRLGVAAVPNDHLRIQEGRRSRRAARVAPAGAPRMGSGRLTTKRTMKMKDTPNGAPLQGGALVPLGRSVLSEALEPHDLIQFTLKVAEVKAKVMKAGVHFGQIPGTPKPTLYQPGAEQLCLAFRFEPRLTVEDLSEPPEFFRYRVTCAIVHIPSGAVMATGLGEASTLEAKYAWREAIGDEFKDAPAERRRVKWKKGRNGPYSVEQVRTDAADLANTVLKMAAKRAHVAGARTATACSDMFAQDLDDLRRAGVDPNGEDGEGEPEPERPPVQQPQPTAPETNGRSVNVEAGQMAAVDVPAEAWDEIRAVAARGGKTITEPQQRRLFAIAKTTGWQFSDVRNVLAAYVAGLTVEEIPQPAYDKVVAVFESYHPAGG